MQTSCFVFIGFSWNTGQTTSLIGPLVNGNYALNVVDSLGCTLDSVFTITQPNPLLIPGAVVNVACFGDSSAYITALPNGGTAPYSYAWNNGQNTQVDTLIPAGNYIVTVTDFNGCIDSALFAVTQPSAPIALTLIQTNVGCFGANTGALDLSVTGGTPAYTYLWSNAFTSQDIQNLSIGNYGVIVTDANGCTDTILTTITQPISPLIVLPTITNSPCFASNGGSIDLNVYGGTTPYTYFWNTTDNRGIDPSCRISKAKYRLNIVRDYGAGRWLSYTPCSIHCTAVEVGYQNIVDICWNI